MGNELITALVLLAALALLVGSFWGGIRLAKRWVKDPVGSVLLGLVFGVVFLIAGTIALIAGCIAVAGSPNFH